MKKSRKKSSTRLRQIVESWNPEDLRRKEKGMKERKGTGEVVGTEESSNQMSYISLKRKSYQMRNDTKLHRRTGSWYPGDLKRKETGDDGEETVEREGETEETDGEEEEKEETEEIDEAVEEDPEVVTAPKRWGQKERKDGSRNYSVGNTRKTRARRKKAKPPNFWTTLSKEEIEEDLRALKASNLIT